MTPPTPLSAFTAGLGVETNTFGSLAVGMEDFRRVFLFGPGEHPAELTEVSAPLHVLRGRRETQGWRVVEGTYAFALPGGRVERDVYETLRDRILDELARALPVDMAAFSLHGAMCADGYDDCEGDLLSRARALVGPDVLIGAELDPHAHLSPAMVEAADMLVAFKEYPHVDFLARGEELIALLEDAARTGRRPARSVFDCRTIGRFHTFRQPMRGLVDAMIEAEGKDGVRSVSLIHGFPWGDVEDAGARCYALADTQEAADRAARHFGEWLIALRDRSFDAPLPLDEAVRRALDEPDGPVVIADVSDNPGGGAPGDGLALMQRLLEAGRPFCLGPFWDPETVRRAHRAGVGARLAVRLGDRPGAARPPLEAEAEVVGLGRDATQGWAGTRMALGDVCALKIGPATVLAASIRDQAYGPDLFEAADVDPCGFPLIVVKSAQHFAAGFGPLARRIVLASGGGPLETDFRRIPYRKVRRPIWPLDPVPPSMS